MKNVAIIIPAYKESQNIAQLCSEVLKFMPSSQILVVDDSPDMLTLNAIHSMNNSQVRIMHRAQKGGRGSAVIDGLNELSAKNFDFIIEMDADFSHPPSQIPELVEYSSKNKMDLLIASRYLPGSGIINWPIKRRIFSRCSNIIAKFLLRVPVSDYTNGFRVYSNQAALEISRTCGRLGSGFIALSEILVNIHYRGYMVGDVPTIFTNRIRGESSLSKKEIWNALVGLKKIYFLRKELLK